MVTCKICNTTHRCIGTHLRHKHKEVSCKDYYDKYLKQDKEGICANCGKPTRFKGITKGYQKFCSKKCSNIYNVNIIKKSNLKKYGVEYPMQTPKIKNKIKQTCLKKYGTENPMQSDIVKEKLKQSNLKKYGVVCTLQEKNTKEKRKQTMLKKYGTEHALKNKTLKNKAEQTCLKNNGVENPFQSAKIKEKSKKTCLTKYGTEYANQATDVKNKIKNSMINRHGVPSYLESNEIITQKKERVLEKQHTFLNTQKENFEILSEPKNRLVKIKCKKCGWVGETLVADPIFHRTNPEILRCYGCYPIKKSHGELDILNFIKNLNITNIVTNTRTIIPPVELDIYLPDFNIAIEYDGIHWHSERLKKDKNYHLNKTIMCKEKNIQLIHVFENEWLEKQEIVKSILCAKLGRLDKLCGARQTTIKTITASLARKFLNKNHIQGYCNSSIKLGAFYNNNLISVITFAKPSIAKGRKDQKSNNYELSRFCCLLNYYIPGMASKFLSYFKNNYLFNNLYTFADIRYSNGSFYGKLGFKQLKPSTPNYWYFRRGKTHLEYRFKYRKSELPKLLPNFNPNLTEYQNMLNNNYDRIWDCGNYKFTLKGNI